MTGILRRAVAADPSQASGHVALASALVANGDDPGAIRELREALRLDPWDAGTHAAPPQLRDWVGCAGEHALLADREPVCAGCAVLERSERMSNWALPHG